MPGLQLIGIAVLGSLLASFTDWLFMDVLVHRFYAMKPEVWRQGESSRRIVISQIVGVVASASVVLLAVLIPGRPVGVAALAWCAGALPVTIQQWQWLNIHPAISASHATGWLVRLLIGTALVAWFRPGW